ncbi:DUF3160 domain-containing protein [bacterium]|nr:DUF3160 domain-containing protein [bacterium]
MKKTKIVIGVLVTLLAVGGVIFLLRSKIISENIPFSPPSTSTIPSVVSPPIKAKSANAKTLIKPEDIVIQSLDIKPNIPGYSLPLSISEIQNYQRVASELNLSPKLLEKLRSNGFVITNSDGLFKKPAPDWISKGIPERFESFYSYLQWLKSCKDFTCTEAERAEGLPVPIFITTDSVLHYYHLVFSSILMRLERSLFFDYLWQMDKDLLESSVALYNQTSDPLMKEAAKRNMAYFSVALKLLQPKESQILTAHRLKDRGDTTTYELIKFECGPSLTNVKCIRDYIETNFPNDFSRHSSFKYTFTVPEVVKKEVAEEINLIEAHQGWKFSPIFVYKEDYSQYIPRGHYSKGERLKNYFKAMMWHGRMTMLIEGSEKLTQGKSECLEDGIISKEDAKIQTLQAALISQEFSKNKQLRDKWQKIYAVTSFLIGYSDDLGPYEYSNILNRVFGEGEINSAQISLLQKELLNLPYNPQIYSGLGGCELHFPYDSQQALQYLAKTKGFRLMGQRYTPDTNMFWRLVSPFSGVYQGAKEELPFTAVRTETGRIVRGFPRGLDIAALLGSGRARYWIHQLGDDNYTDYAQRFNELEKEIKSFDTSDWFKNIYFSWLYTLQPLLNKFGSGYPTFMQTEAYQDKNLNTFLASWTQLHHDTILYTKQSGIIAEGGGSPEHPPSRGYVEPVPEFYSRLLLLAKITERGLENLLTPEELEGVIRSSYFEITQRKENVLAQLSIVLQKLFDISKKELENKTLNEDEYSFIDHFGDVSSFLIETLLSNEEKGSYFAERMMEGKEDILRSTLIADVHTDGNSQQVLEEGVGKIKAMLVAYRLPDGRILLGMGPVFSYYEFKWPMNDRLTDEKWREMIKTNPPTEPQWARTFSP